ncbi:MAG: PD-(D/E)XK nuclease family protein [Cyanobacteria bacterium J06648_16]
MLSAGESQSILGKLIIDNSDLELLESKLSNFNIFEAIGMVGQEIRHSNFLALLLNPSEVHGLGDAFLKKLLIQMLTEAEELPFSPIEIDLLNLKDSEVEENGETLIYSSSRPPIN